ncbi:MAG: hypothetical protein HKN92_00835 [Chitinophagales bacterium]|nr:hypothetical protein [Chitinophagales bacterium]
MNEQQIESQNKFKKWFKKIGILGLLFFTIKGLVWLAIFFGLGKWLVN